MEGSKSSANKSFRVNLPVVWYILVIAKSIGGS
jgi:hypothetical protein